MELVSTVRVGDQWVTQCAWAPWKTSDGQTGRWNTIVGMRSHIRSSAASTLACGMSNGDVILIDLTQKLHSPPRSPFRPEVTTVVRNEKAAIADKRVITAMRWVSRQDGTVSRPASRSVIHHSCQVANPCLQ